jgi:TrmH family RNA methyltransferase
MTQAQIKTSKYLHTRKGRKELNLFLVEGEKNVLELLASDLEVEAAFGTDEFCAKHRIELISATSQQLERAGTLQTNSSALAWAKIPIAAKPKVKGAVIALDGVSDPGNLGTIWRIADWFGVEQIWLSNGCVDAFSPKVVGASMGAFIRVKPIELNLVEALAQVKTPVFCADMKGISVFEAKFPQDYVLVLGNESKGLSSEIKKFCSQLITIPRWGRAESLNVAVACGIIVAQASKGKV